MNRLHKIQSFHLSLIKKSREENRIKSTRKKRKRFETLNHLNNKLKSELKKEARRHRKRKMIMGIDIETLATTKNSITKGLVNTEPIIGEIENAEISMSSEEDITTMATEDYLDVADSKSEKEPLPQNIDDTTNPQQKQPSLYNNLPSQIS
jgi:hypothetical protein